MRLDHAGPRTWLLVTLAGWALLAWLLALAGMGARLEPLEADPGLLPPLPPLQSAPPLRLGPIQQYNAIAARPLFAEDRRPHPFFLQGEGEVQDDAFDYVLTSVLLTPKLKLAILQRPDGGRSVRVRLEEAPASHPAWQLVDLQERSAVFAGPEGERTLQLRVYDGIGGPPPTAVAVPQPGADPRIPIAPPRSPLPPEAEMAGEQAAAEPPPPPEPESGMVDSSEAEPAPMTEEAQMEAIRQRIQARREQLRQQSQSPDENR